MSILNPHPQRLHGPTLLHELVQPPSQATALYHKDGERNCSFSYRELHQAADALASRISRSHQSSADSQRPFVVPVLIAQSPQLYISLLAVLKAGGAFCPLHLDAPPQRIKYIFDDVEGTVALTTRSLSSKIPPEVGTHIICVDEDDDHTIDDQTQVPYRVPASEDLSYIMYTSGSTGTPKGVGISHSAVTQALLSHDEIVPSFARFLQFAAPTFDVSIFEIFFPLFRGSTVVSVCRQQMLDDLPAVLCDARVDACELTPTVAASLLRSRERAPNLKLLLTIGEMLNERVTREFGGDLDNKSVLWAMYGPTEATIHW